MLYNFSDANLAKWQTALTAVRAGTANAKVACIGDSTTMGYGAAANGYVGARSLSYPSRLAQILDACYAPAQNDSFFGDAHVTATSTTPYPQYDPRVAMGAGWGFYASNSLGGYLFTGGTAPLSFVPSRPVDTFDIYYLKNADFSVNVDGNSALASVTSQNVASVAKLTVTAALGQHTLNIVPGSNGPVYIVGVDAYDSAAKKIAVLNMGFGGAQAKDWADSSQLWSPLPSLPVPAPDLSLICLGINDWANSVDPATWMGQMQAVINAVAASGSVILIAPVPSATSIASIAKQKALIDAMYALSDKNAAPLIDLTAAWGSFAAAQPNGYYYDPVEHPSGDGYFDVAKMIATAIAG